MAKMGLQFGLDGNTKACKRQHRWLFRVPDVVADDSPGANALPPEKSARPNLSFKEMEVNHLIEDYSYPAKPEWKPITIVLYDLKRSESHPVWEWIKEVYEVNEKTAEFFEPNANDLIKVCSLELFDGPGNVVETWVFEDAWPNNINFQTLDMTQSSVVMCEFTLKYARAYVQYGSQTTAVN